MTPALSGVFPSDIDPYLPALRYAWIQATGHDFDAWQIDLLRRVFEVYPDGHPLAGELRYRQVIISMARQQGKTEIAAAIGLYGLLREGASAYVVGIASSAEQARLVYDRAANVVASNPALKRRFSKLTETRGLRTIEGGRWEVKAAKSASLQGIPTSVAICDEVHLLKPALWTDLLNGLGGRRNGIVVGITTAGDDSSELLKSLYINADKAIAGDLDRFGAFIYEASAARIPDDDAELGRLLMEAGPALAEGHAAGNLAAVIADVRSMPADEAIRYRLNRFVSGSSGFMDSSLWGKASTVEPMPTGKAVIAIDRTTDWSSATVAAAWKAEDGAVWTELVGSTLRPSLDQLERMAVALWQTGRVQTFVLDAYGLKELATRLQDRGYPVQTLGQAQQYQAPSTLYALTARGKLRHPGDPLMTMQLPRAGTKAQGEAYRIVRGASGSDIDAVIATVEAVYVAETRKDMGLQIS
ncbi:terminase large subunit domain-containing protein [Curtobacterium sp. MCPF17_003]|uniref:terminase large subunit domain-containing protein n=1 Tax=Curtobacterium sp. MCPF17_003 TaxID=2175637 RepID=UPI0015E88374|nr:terminase large subunit [Curtobacterium sp. MCPF17_003]